MTPLAVAIKEPRAIVSKMDARLDTRPTATATSPAPKATAHQTLQATKQAVTEQATPKQTPAQQPTPPPDQQQQPSPQANRQQSNPLAPHPIRPRIRSNSDLPGIAHKTRVSFEIRCQRRPTKLTHPTTPQLLHNKQQEVASSKRLNSVHPGKSGYLHLRMLALDPG